MFKLTLLISLLCLSNLALAAGPIKISYDLNESDSFSLEGLHIGPYSQQTDSDGWQTLSSKYATTDDAFEIDCSVRNVAGSFMNQKCTISIDSSAAKPDSTKVSAGVVGNVVVIKFINLNDVSRLTSILSPMPFYATSEVVQVALPNGKSAQYEKFRIDCDSNANTCSALLFP